MDNHEELFDKLFDVLLDEAAKDYDSKPELDLPNDAELPDIIFSEQHEKKMKKIFAAERRKYALKYAGMCATRVAACIGALAILSCITLVSVNSEFRAGIKNIIFNINNTNTDISFVEKDNTNTYILDNIAFGYIPDDFSISYEQHTSEIDTVFFENAKVSFTIVIQNGNGKISVDTNYPDYEIININGFECFFSESANENIIAMYVEQKICTISGNISKDEIIKIAQNVKIQ